MIKLPTWNPSPDAIAQTSHFFIATTIVFFVSAVLGNPVHAGFFMVLFWALPKEFVFDLVIERDSFLDSVIDFWWYVVGGVAASLVLIFDGYRIF